jgi:hypothetical protein
MSHSCVARFDEWSSHTHSTAVEAQDTDVVDSAGHDYSWMGEPGLQTKGLASPMPKSAVKRRDESVGRRYGSQADKETTR